MEYWGEEDFDVEQMTVYNLPPTRVMFVGDSILAGYGLDDPEENNIVAQIESNLKENYSTEFREIRIKNFSISGETTSGMVSRMRQVVAAQPDIVVLAIGGNDALRGVDPDVLYNNLNIILNDLNRAGIYVLFAGMQSPPNYGYTYMSKFNSVYAKLAEQYPVVFMPFLLEGVAANRDLNQDDGIHPNHFGASIIADNLLEYLRKMIKAMQKEKAKRVHENRLAEIERINQQRKAKREQKQREYDLRKQKLKRKYENSLKK